MIIPVGYHTWTITMTVDGTSRSVVNTFAGVNNLDFTAAPINAAYRTAFVTTATRPYAAGVLPSTYSIASTKALANIGGVLYSDENFTPVVGVFGGAVPPINTAILVAKATGIAGRKFRGRVFAPPALAEGDVDQVGVIAGATVTTHQGRWTAAFGALDTANYDQVLLHTDGSAPTPLTGFVVSQRIGTIGRRMRG